MTVEIKLNTGVIVLIDDEDADLTRLRWYDFKLGYAARKTRGRKVTMHRVILGRMLGRDLQPGEEVDHINGVKNDNRRANLRLATRSQNMRNVRGLMSNNTSGYRGVSWHKRTKKWSAQIGFDGRAKFLGYFTTAEAAAEAYRIAAIELYGEFSPFSDPYLPAQL